VSTRMTSPDRLHSLAGRVECARTFRRFAALPDAKKILTPAICSTPRARHCTVRPKQFPNIVDRLETRPP